MSTSLGNAYNVTNLFYSGTFALRNGDDPAVWLLGGFGATGANVYALKERGLEVALGSRAAVTLSQDFATFSAPFDFTLPLPGGALPHMAPGYLTQNSRTLPSSTPYTVSLEVTVGSGLPGFRVYYVTPAGTFYGSTEYIRAAAGSTSRISLQFEQTGSENDDMITEVGIEMQADTAAVFTVDALMLAPGYHSDLPYTGDPFTQVFPAGCIVMTVGQTCPTGFKELGEGGLTPPASWEAGEPGIRARLGNYPRTGNDFAGDPLHSADASKVQTGSENTRDFEGYDGRLYQEYANTEDNSTAPPGGYVFTVNSQNPDVDRSETHDHEIGPAKTRPVSIGLIFCERQ